MIVASIPFEHQGVHDLDVEGRAFDFAGDDTIVEVGLTVFQAGTQSSDQRLAGLARSTIGGQRGRDPLTAAVFLR